MRRRRARFSVSEELPAHDRWLFSYADFVTLLFAVFVVLFAVAWQRKPGLGTVSSAIHGGFDSLGAGGAKPVAVQPPPPQAATVAAAAATAPAIDESELYRKLKGILGDSISKQEIAMHETPDGLVISLRELGFFGSGEAKLLPGAEEKLKQAATVLNDDGLELRVEGHSDDQPIHNALYRSNWELSTARAMSVLNLLVDDAGFPPERISAAGYGPFRPVASNATAEGRKSNRRVDLVVMAPATRGAAVHTAF